MLNIRKTMMLASCLCALSGAAHAQAVSLSGVLTDAEDGNRFFTRLGGTAEDKISYRGLKPGTGYVLVSRLINAETGDALDPVNTEFTPEAAEGEVSVRMPVPR